MAVTLVIGSQWGDEGKGKIIDYLSHTQDIVVRFHGGNNAGHTVKNQYGKFAMHIIPCGIFNKKVKAVIGSGVVFDLEVLLGEIAMLEKAGIEMKGRLFISPRCHLIMPYHKILDRVYEELKGASRTGTTGRGIGPAHADKVSYNGIRVADLANKKQFKETLKVQLSIKNKILAALGEKPLSQQDIEHSFFALFDKIRPFVAESYLLLQEALQTKKSILLEGAQGVFLDNDWGTYPFVTASTIVSGQATAGAGIAPKHIKNIIGVAKAYTTRVGQGPFPTELLDKTGDLLTEKGNEFGATTGRRRRCGWFDAELVRFAAELNGFTEIAITKLDVLDGFETLKICTSYTYNGKSVGYVDGDATFLSKVKPTYITVPGWKEPTREVTTYNDLPNQAKEYLSQIEKLVGVKITYISTGEKRGDTIVKS